MSDAESIAPVRGPALATHGMVASEHPLATQAGLAVLRAGGNAFDAALAVSAVLTVVKPHRSHLGGDAFVLVRPADSGEVTAVCSGGKAPAAATRERYAGGIPAHGGAACAVPGLVDAWQVISDRWCSRPLAALLEPAVGYAREGFGVSRELAATLDNARGFFAKYPGMARALFVDGAPPRFGARFRQPDLARTLETIAREGRAGFYEGPVARRIAEDVQSAGGCLTAEDLSAHRADVLEPLAAEYRGCTVYETPPNSQGVILLEELRILEGFDLAGWGRLSADALHHMIEAKKLAFEDRRRYAGDPAETGFDARSLLTDAHIAARRAAIDRRRAAPRAEPVATSDTTSFVVVDAAGNVCSFIQSIFAHFGAAVAIEGTGIIMNNRMTGFSLDPASPNALAPGKRTMHTLNTWLAERDGRPWLVGNTPGADFQVQTNLQVLTAIIDHGLDPQAAVDAPRWGHTPDAVLVEAGIPEATQLELAARGHVLRPVARATNPTGRAQCIEIRDDGVLIGGSDSRGEGSAAGW